MQGWHVSMVVAVAALVASLVLVAGSGPPVPSSDVLLRLSGLESDVAELRDQPTRDEAIAQSTLAEIREHADRAENAAQRADGIAGNIEVIAYMLLVKCQDELEEAEAASGEPLSPYVPLSEEEFKELQQRVRIEQRIAGFDFVYFTAQWCPGCRTQKPILEELEADGYRVLVVDETGSGSSGQWEQTEMARHFGIEALPAYVAIVDGEAVTDASTGKVRVSHGMYPTSNPNRWIPDRQAVLDLLPK